MQYSSFFKSINGDRKYKVDIFAAYFASFVGNGVFGKSLENLAVLAKEGMNIIVKPGKAWINGYFYINDSDLNFKLDNADGVLKRIDRLVIRWSLLDRKISIEIKKGVMSQEPTPAVLKRDGEVYELAIADILIGNGVIAITKAMITDLRLDSNLCGIVTGVIDQVDTTTLFNQIQGEVEDMKLWVESEKDEINRILEAAIGETLAGELINMINANTSSITALDKKVNANEEAITKKGNCNARFLQGETIPTASWVATTADYLPPTIATQLMADYPFMADITLAEINETWKADILPDLKGQEILAPVNVTSSGIVRIYAKEKPAEDISILNLELRKAVV